MGFFKAYDMRGTFGVDFNLDTVYRVALALPKVVTPRAKGESAPRWLVGRDCRMSSSAVHDALLKGLSEAGAEVSDLGLSTTPMVYFFTAKDGFDGSVMITASHNPPSDNGLKVSKATALPVGYADGLDKVERMVMGGERLDAGEEGAASQVKSPAPVRSIPDSLSRYVAWQVERCGDLSNLKFAVDSSNGMAGMLVKKVFPNAVLINDVADGSFPAHSPNPLKAESREEIARLVREKGLDCGVIFDGDADRAMFVDERGEFVQPDYLIPVVARSTRTYRTTALPHHPTTALPNPLKVIHDVRTSRGAIETLKEDGFEPVMVPVGHAFAKPALRRVGALCGGELAGHYYFSEFFGCDSGLLAATRVLGEVAKAKAEGMTFSEMMRPIVSRYANSGELNFKVEDKEAAVARALAAAARELPPEVSRSEMDGVRVEYENGWFNIRKSNTEPFLRLVVECDTLERLKSWLSVIKAAIL